MKWNDIIDKINPQQVVIFNMIPIVVQYLDHRQYMPIQ